MSHLSIGEAGFEGFKLVDNQKTSQVVLMAVLVVEHDIIFWSFSTSTSLRLENSVCCARQSTFILFLLCKSKFPVISKCRWDREYKLKN